jgi:hypothetical protein
MYVRRSVFIAAPQSVVWSHFDSFERICVWLNQGHVLHRFDVEPGGIIDLSVTIDSQERHFGGRVLCVEPGCELSVESQWEAPSSWPLPTLWTWRLSALYEGTLVEFFHHGFERLGAIGADQLQDYEQGWGLQHLLSLRTLAERT